MPQLMRPGFLINPRATTAAAEFFTDTFTDAEAAELSAHTPDVGQSWTLLEQASTHVLEVVDTPVANELRPSATATAPTASIFYVANTVSPLPSADYEVSADMYLTTTSGVNGDTIQGLAIRVQDIDNMYGVGLFGVGNNWVLFKIVAGSPTTLDSENLAGSVTAAVNVRLRIEGSDIEVLVDGSPLLAATDADITAIGKPGIWVGELGNFSTTGDAYSNVQRFDNFAVTPIG